MEAITSQIDFIFNQYPAIKHIVAVYFIIRMINKPLFAFIGKYVQLSEGVKDDEIFNKIVNSKAYKLISFALDISLSIKIPKGGK